MCGGAFDWSKLYIIYCTHILKHLCFNAMHPSINVIMKCSQSYHAILMLHWTSTQLWTKATVCWTFPHWTLCHQSLTLCVALSLLLNYDRWCFCTFPTSCSLWPDPLWFAHLCTFVYSHAMPLLAYYASTFESLNIWSFDIYQVRLDKSMPPALYIYLALHCWEEIAMRCMDSRTACSIESPEPSWQLNGWHQSLHTFH